MAKEVQLITRLGFARGMIGGRNALSGADEELKFARGLAQATRPLVRVDTADCGDDRRIVRLADGTVDPSALSRRVVPQLLGGLVLATAKAAFAADAQFLNGTKNFQQAYVRTDSRLSGLGYEDGGHAGCGASASVEESVANHIAADELSSALSLFMPIDDMAHHLIADIQSTKERKLQSGEYGVWSPKWHEDFLSEKYPQNFSYLASDPDDHETQGHHGAGIYVIEDDGMGFAKNSFIDATARESFAVTLPLATALADALGENGAEKLKLRIAFLDDMLHVASGLVAPGMPVFAEAS